MKVFQQKHLEIDRITVKTNSMSTNTGGQIKQTYSLLGIISTNVQMCMKLPNWLYRWDKKRQFNGKILASWFKREVDLLQRQKQKNDEKNKIFRIEIKP